MNIQVHDNFYENDHCQEIYDFVNKSYFKIGWEDSDEPQHKPYPNLHSIYSKEDLDKIKILKPILKKFKIPKDNYLKCIVNLTKPLDVNFIHVHPNMSVALYYANLTWNPEWGGETIFYKKDKKTIDLANPYVPNRLVFFDGKIPHTIKTQNIIGPSYRFTISLFFIKK
jgi:Rps23 Pro-64 3,4-dihydroxylase Tpa1-like proline 4-hydroxylase